MKSLFVVSPVPGKGAGAPRPVAERRRHQRRMGVARRTAPDRRVEDGSADPAERRAAGERRGSGSRRRRHDRRIGLSPDLDLYLLGI